MPTTDELQAQIDTLKTQVPSLEDLMFANTICCWSNSTQTPIRDVGGAVWATLANAPIPMRVLSVMLSFEYWTLAASDTAYWQADLAVRGPSTAGAYNICATRTTQITGANANGGIVARQAWTFDAATWTSADMQAGDALLLKPSVPASAPASNWRFPMTATVRYRPL